MVPTLFGCVFSLKLSSSKQFLIALASRYCNLNTDMTETSIPGNYGSFQVTIQG